MSQIKNELTLKRLRGKYAVERLFTEGTVFSTKHLIFRVVKQEKPSAFYAGVSVSKKTFKKAVDRNRIKRQLRVALKTHEHLLSFPGNGMLIFKGKRQLSTQSIINETHRLLEKI